MQQGSSTRRPHTKRTRAAAGDSSTISVQFPAPSLEQSSNSECDDSGVSSEMARLLKEQLGAASGQQRCMPMFEGVARTPRAPSCGLPCCADQNAHINEPWITEQTPNGERVPKRCESDGCDMILFRCEVRGAVWGDAQAGRRLSGLMRCNKCRGGYGLCVETSLAKLLADKAETSSNVTALKQYLLHNAIKPDGVDEIRAGKMLAAVMKAVDACVEGAPADAIIVVAVQLCGADWIHEIYDLWLRDGIEALLVSLGASAPAEDGSDLVFTAATPFIRADLAKMLETDGQFTVLGRILKGEDDLYRQGWVHQNTVPAFTRATARNYKPGGGRDPGASAMGQGHSAEYSSAGVSVWRLPPLPAGALQPTRRRPNAVARRRPKPQVDGETPQEDNCDDYM